jgi:hypothetical protein
VIGWRRFLLDCSPHVTWGAVKGPFRTEMGVEGPCEALLCVKEAQVGNGSRQQVSRFVASGKHKSCKQPTSDGYAARLG